MNVNSIAYRSCLEPGCTKHREFGNPGGRAQVCRDHKSPDMVRHPGTQLLDHNFPCPPPPPPPSPRAPPPLSMCLSPGGCDLQRALPGCRVRSARLVWLPRRHAADVRHAQIGRHGKPGLAEFCLSGHYMCSVRTSSGSCCASTCAVLLTGRSIHLDYARSASNSLEAPRAGCPHDIHLLR